MQMNVVIALRGVSLGVVVLVDDCGVALFEVVHHTQFEEQGCPITYFECPRGTLEADEIVIDAVQWLEKEAKGCLECSLLALPQELMALMYGLDHFCEAVNNIVKFK